MRVLDGSSFGRPACRDSARAGNTVQSDEDDAARATNGTERKTVEGSRSRPLFPRRGERLLPSVGLLARGSCCAPSPFPEAGVVDVQPRVVWEIASPLTVAGPRRPFTGLPFYALMGTESFSIQLSGRKASSLVLRRVSRRTASNRATDRLQTVRDAHVNGRDRGPSDRSIRASEPAIRVRRRRCGTATRSRNARWVGTRDHDGPGCAAIAAHFAQRR